MNARVGIICFICLASSSSAAFNLSSSVPMNDSQRFIGRWEKKFYLREIASAVVLPDDPVPKYLKPLEEIMRVLNLNFDYTTDDIKCCLRMLLPDSFTVEDEEKLKKSIAKEIKPIQIILKLLIDRYFGKSRDDPLLQIRKQVYLILTELRKKAYFLVYLNQPHVERLLGITKVSQCPKCSVLQPLPESEQHYDLERKDLKLHLFVQTVFYQLKEDDLRFYNEYASRLMRQLNMKYEHLQEELKCCLRQALFEGDQTELAEFLMRRIESLRKRLKPLIFDALFMKNQFSPLAKEVQMILEGIRKNTDFLILLSENNIMTEVSGQSNDTFCTKCQEFDRPPSVEAELMDTPFMMNDVVRIQDENNSSDYTNFSRSEALDDPSVLVETQFTMNDVIPIHDEKSNEWTILNRIALLQKKVEYFSIAIIILLVVLLFCVCYLVVYLRTSIRNKRFEYELPITNYQSSLLSENSRFIN